MKSDEPNVLLTGEAEDPAAEPDYEQLIIRSLRRVIRAIDIHSRDLGARHNITLPQLLCLRSLESHGPQTSVEIGRRIHLSPSTLVGVLDRLEKKGLVTRTRDVVDRRRVAIDLTETGRTVLAQAPPPLQEKFRLGLSRMTDARKRAVADALEEIVSLMEAESIDASPVLVSGEIAE